MEKLEGIEGDIQLVETMFTTGELRPASKTTFTAEEDDAIRTVIVLAKKSVISDTAIASLVEELTDTVNNDTLFPDELVKWLNGVIDKLALIPIGGEKENGDRQKEEKSGLFEDGDRRDEDPKD